MNGVDLKEIRKGLRLSQSEFATAIGISQPYLSDLENDRRNITHELEVLILNLSSEGNYKNTVHGHARVNEHKVPYYSEKKDLLDILKEDLGSDKVIRVNEFVSHGRYKPNNILCMKKHTGIMIYGMPYVIYFKGVQHPVICTVYPDPENENNIRLKKENDLPAQTVPRNEIYEIYTVTHNIETYT